MEADGLGRRAFVGGGKHVRSGSPAITVCPCALDDVGAIGEDDLE